MGEDRTVINSILASYDYLSDSERRIADFILQRTGVGTSLSFAQMVATRLSRVGAKAVSPATTDAASFLAQLMGPEDCVVFISSSAKSRRLNIIMDNVQDSDIPSIITADPTTHLASRTDHVLAVSSRDHLLANNFAVSHSPLNFVVECMALLLFHDSPDAEEYLRMFQKTIPDEKQTADAAPRSLHRQQAPPPHCLLGDARRPVPSQCARHLGCPS